jgi:hypothetical protein
MQNISETCSTHLQNITETCPVYHTKYLTNMLNTPAKQTRNMPRTHAKYLSNVPGIPKKKNPPKHAARVLKTTQKVHSGQEIIV